MPRANQYLLLYVLDLLSVFARKSDKNLMTAGNLAVIFRPGIISHPDQELSPQQHKLSQDVLEFLIEQQDWFLLDIPPPPRNDSILIPPSSPMMPDQEEVYMVPSESDEEAPSGGWKLVERGKQPPVQFSETPGVLSPVLTPSPSPNLPAGGATGVKRSVTVPSRRSGKSGTDSIKLAKKKKGDVSPARGPNSLKRSGSVQMGDRRALVTTTTKAQVAPTPS